MPFHASAKISQCECGDQQKKQKPTSYSVRVRIKLLQLGGGTVQRCLQLLEFGRPGSDAKQTLPTEDTDRLNTDIYNGKSWHVLTTTQCLCICHDGLKCKCVPVAHMMPTLYFICILQNKMYRLNAPVASDKCMNINVLFSFYYKQKHRSE